MKQFDDERARVGHLIETQGVEYVKVGIPDIARGVSWMSISASRFLDALQGGGPLSGLSPLPPDRALRGEHSIDDAHSSTALLEPDLATFALTPWSAGEATCFCDPAGPPEPPSTTRQALIALQQHAFTQGYSLVSSAECHLQVFQDGGADAAAKDSDSSAPLLGPTLTLHAIQLPMSDEELLSGITRLLRQQGIDVEQGYRSQAAQPGSYTIRLARNTPLQLADQITLLREACREIVQELGLGVVFRAPSETRAADVCFSISPWDSAREANLFWDREARAHLSLLARRFLTGMLDTLPEFTTLYTRGLPLSADQTDSACAFRVHTRDQRTTRLENCIPGTNDNPYLVLAVMVAGGLYGIEKKHTVPLAWEEDSYHQFLFSDSPSCIPLPPLPRNPWVAQDKLEQSQAAHEYLGTALVSHILSTPPPELHNLHGPESQ
jgi:glutamine synthetase